MNTLVIGSGITGIRIALDLAKNGVHVHLVERQAAMGGKMALLDKTFPTNDCSICLLAPKMSECINRDNIDFYTLTDVEDVKGSAGDFEVTLLKRARYINEKKCTGCGLCMEHCPTSVPDPINDEFSNRKAIYIPYPQAVPRIAAIDPEHCKHLTEGKCGTCKKICPRDAVDFSQMDQFIKINVQSIIVATGADIYRPFEIEKYQYGKVPGVLTSFELERLLCPTGPTEGELVLKGPYGVIDNIKDIAFILCVGSRGEVFEHCSSVCCSHATKQAILIREMFPDINTTIFYRDFRTFGKNFENYVERSKTDYDVNYHRATVEKIERTENKRIRILFDETSDRELKTEEFDLVVLSTALIPPKGTKELAAKLDIKLDKWGFFQSKNPLIEPTSSTREGIYLAGCCLRPKDITFSVIDASSAAAKAMELMNENVKKEVPV
ncbi:4Fe-4S binding protein [[Eubacterium] cellulosolvens]